MYFLSSIHFLLQIPTSRFFIRRSAFDISFYPIFRTFLPTSYLVPGTLYNSSPYFVLRTLYFVQPNFVFRTSYFVSHEKLPSPPPTNPLDRLWSSGPGV